MSLQVIYGRAHCGKTSYIMELVKKLNKDGNEIILIVPEQFTHIAEIRLLEATGKILDGEIEIMSFKKLAQRCIELYAKESFKQIDTVGRSLIVARAVENSELKYFKNAGDYSGFVDLVLKEIGNFKKYSITCDDINALINSEHAENNEVFKLKMQDLSSIYSLYDQILHENYIDAEDILDILVKILGTQDIFKNKTIILDEFSTFIPQEENVLKALAKQCKNMYVTLCLDSVTDGDMNVFMPTVTTYLKLKDMCRKDKITFEKPVFLETSYYNNDALKHLEQNLFKYPAKIFESNQENIELFSAKNPYTEVEYTAEKIISLVSDGGVRFKDIGIICADINAYSHIFKMVFDKYKIPYFIDEKIPVLSHHIIQFVLNIFDVYISGYSHESIFNFLKSGFCEISAKDASICENFALKTNITRRGWTDNEKWESIILNQKFRNKKERDVLCCVRERYILPLAEFHEKIKGRNDARFVCEQTYKYLTQIGIDKMLEAYADNARDFGDAKGIKRAKEYESIYNVLVKTIDELYEFLGDTKVSPERFKNYMLCALNQQTIGLIPTALDEIIIGDIARTKTEYCDVLFIIGANDGVFPSRPAGDVILGEKDKQIIENSGFEYTRSLRNQSYFNQFLIYSVFTLANNKIYLSYSGADNDYKTLSPAFAVNRIKKLFKDIEISDSLTDTVGIDKITIADVSFEYLACIMNDLKAGNRNVENDDKWSSVYGYYKEKYPQKIERLEKLFANKKRHYETISPDILNKLMGDGLYTTVSRLQKYNACKYSYFLSYLLDLKQPQTNEIQSLDIGIAAHSVFEYIGSFLQTANKSYENLTDDEITKKVCDYLNELIEMYALKCDKLSERQKFIFEKMKNELELCVKIIRNQIIETKFIPLGYEIEFSDNSQTGTINITLDDGKCVKLTGKIDRADVLNNGQYSYVRIVDYKTGSKTFSLSDIVNGTDIQLAVYLNALVKSNKNYMPAGAFYFSVQDPISKQVRNVSDSDIQNDILASMKLKGIVLDEEFIKKENTDKKSQSRINTATKEQFEIMDKYVTKLIKSSLTDMLGGNIDARPYKNRDKTPCAYCEYSSICRFELSGNDYNNIKSYGRADDAWEVMYNEMDN